MNELFIISPASFRATDMESVTETCDALRELGLFKLPYPKVDIQIAVDSVKLEDVDGRKCLNMKLHLTDGPSDFSYLVVGLDETGKSEMKHIHSVRDNDTCSWTPTYDLDTGLVAKLDIGLVELLVALLATKNAEKRTHVNKLAKLGIGKHKHRNTEKAYARVTTITVPEDLSDDDHTVIPGKAKCAHLRRGHIRRQKYGPDFCLVRQIWIEPIFVNADKDFVSKRTRYNVSLGHADHRTDLHTHDNQGVASGRSGQEHMEEHNQRVS